MPFIYPSCVFGVRRCLINEHQRMESEPVLSCPTAGLCPPGVFFLPSIHLPSSSHSCFYCILRLPPHPPPFLAALDLSPHPAFHISAQLTVYNRSQTHALPLREAHSPHTRCTGESGPELDLSHNSLFLRLLHFIESSYLYWMEKRFGCKATWTHWAWEKWVINSGRVFSVLLISKHI